MKIKPNKILEVSESVFFPLGIWLLGETSKFSTGYRIDFSLGFSITLRIEELSAMMFFIHVTNAFK